MAPGHQLDQGLFLGGKELEPQPGNPVEEPFQDVVGRDCPSGLGQAVPQAGRSHLCSLPA